MTRRDDDWGLEDDAEKSSQIFSQGQCENVASRVINSLHFSSKAESLAFRMSVENASLLMIMLQLK